MVDEFGFGAIATYSCNDGYRLDGPDMITCDENNEWTPSPLQRGGYLDVVRLCRQYNIVPECNNKISGAMAIYTRVSNDFYKLW